MVVYIGHVISVVVFMAVIITAGYMASTLKSSTLPPCYLWVPRVVVIVLFFQATIFLFVQADYLVGNHGNIVIEDIKGSARVLYDIFTGMALITFATALNILFRWKRPNGRCKTDCPLRREHDRIL